MAAIVFWTVRSKEIIDLKLRLNLGGTGVSNS